MQQKQITVDVKFQGKSQKMLTLGTETKKSVSNLYSALKCESGEIVQLLDKLSNAFVPLWFAMFELTPLRSLT